MSRIALGVLAAACTATVVGAQNAAALRFLTDDPIRVDDDRARDASGVRRDSLGGYADFVLNTFFQPGDRRDVRAMNVNTLDEVPDSSWFTNRIGTGQLSLEEIVRGPDRVAAPGDDGWIVVEGKDTGRQAGFRAVRASDPGGDVYQIEFDPVGNPEMATGAEIIGTAIYHAIGYNVVDVYLVEVDPGRLSIAPSATVEAAGRRRPFTRRDLDGILGRAARRPDGRYRATASRFAEGQNVGPFRYYGTRPDDPNDIYPHEHRRELRANRVFGAWLNHDDSRAVNTLDMLVSSEGRPYIRHYMFDFGSILGSGTNEEDHPWVGREYVVQGRPALLTLASFGLWRRPHLRVQAPSHLPAAGNFTADGFDPERWRPHYPNAAFANLQPDDAFWAARIVAAFTPAAIARIVEKAQFTDPEVVDYVTGTLIRRRAAVLRTWLTAVPPLGQASIGRDRVLRFENAAVTAGVAGGPGRYDVAWLRFDNATGRRSYVAFGRTSDGAAASLPAHLEGSDYIGAEIRAVDSGDAVSRAPVTFYFRANGLDWEPVGVDRNRSVEGERLTRR